jgi:hypothetical protein
MMYGVKWVLIKKASELTGYTEKALNNKIDDGVWAQGLHWKKAPDGRRMINLEKFEEWVETAA